MLDDGLADIEALNQQIKRATQMSIPYAMQKSGYSSRVIRQEKPN